MPLHLEGPFHSSEHIDSHDILITFIRLRTPNLGHAHDYRTNKVPESDENLLSFTVAEAYKTISSTEYGQAVGKCDKDQGVGGCEIRSVVVNTSIVDFFRYCHSL